MTLTNKIRGEEYHLFVGREFSSDGTEQYVALSLPDGACSCFEPTPRGYVLLLQEVVSVNRRGQSVLLYHSPGNLEQDGRWTRTYVPFSAEIQQMFRELVAWVKEPNNEFL